jgi:hypothetical protein
MRKIWMPSIVVAITLTAGIAAAQSPPPPAPGGAFESLSPGNQKIALAIFDSERRAGPSASTKPLSLDQIAERKQSGKGWGEVFKGMKSQGLVQDRNLGQAVSRQAVSQTSRGGGRATAAGTEITTASGKTVMVGGNGRSDAALSGRRGFGSGDARGDTATSAAGSRGRDGGGGASAAGGIAGSHGGGHGK